MFYIHTVVWVENELLCYLKFNSAAGRANFEILKDPLCCGKKRSGFEKSFSRMKYNTDFQTQLTINLNQIVIKPI